METGSSATTSSGPSTSAPAITTRWRWPPESSCGKRKAKSGAGRSPAASIASRTRRSRSLARGAMPLDHERLGHEVEDRLLGVQRLVRVLEDELDAAPVSPQREPPHTSVTSWPSRSMRPPVGRVSLTMTRPVVVLPEPDSPTSPRTSPRADGQVDAVDGADGAEPAPEDRVREARRGSGSGPASPSRRTRSSVTGRAPRRARRHVRGSMPGGVSARDLWERDEPARAGAAGRVEVAGDAHAVGERTSSGGTSCGRRPSPAGSAGGTGSRAAGSAGPAGSPGMSPGRAGRRGCSGKAAQEHLRVGVARLAGRRSGPAPPPPPCRRT